MALFYHPCFVLIVGSAAFHIGDICAPWSSLHTLHHYIDFITCIPLMFALSSLTCLLPATFLLQGSGSCAVSVLSYEKLVSVSCNVTIRDDLFLCIREHLRCVFFLIADITLHPLHVYFFSARVFLKSILGLACL